MLFAGKKGMIEGKYRNEDTALKFFQDNSRRIFRVLINQVGMIIFSLVVTLTAVSMGEGYKKPMTLVASIFAIGLYLFLVFYCMREEGTRDSVKIEGGRLAYDPIYGLKVGLFASVPNFILVFLMALGLILGTAGVGLFTVGYLLTNLVAQSMYAGVMKTLFEALSLTDNYLAVVVAYAVTTLFAPAAAWVGYINGVHRPIVNNQKD